MIHVLSPKDENELLLFHVIIKFLEFCNYGWGFNPSQEGNYQCYCCCNLLIKFFNIKSFISKG